MTAVVVTLKMHEGGMVFSFPKALLIAYCYYFSLIIGLKEMIKLMM